MATPNDFGPAYPLPLGVSYKASAPAADPSNTDPINPGGMDFTYTVSDLSGYTAVGWGQGLPAASMNGPNLDPDGLLTYDPSASTGMTAVWSGLTSIVGVGEGSYTGPVHTELVATILSGATGWTTDIWSNPATDPAVVALIDSGTFAVNLEWLASSTGNPGSYVSMQTFFDDQKAAAGDLRTSSDGEFAGQLATWQAPSVLNDFSWAQGWGSPDNPRQIVETTTNPVGGADYIGFGSSSVIMAFGDSTANGPTFANPIAAIHNFGSTEGYTAAVQRGAADTGNTIAPTVYGQGFKGVYWYDATGGTGTDPTYQATPNLYPNFGSQQGWSPANGFDVVNADSTDAFASILGFGSAGIVVGPQAFDPSTASSPAATYTIQFGAGNNNGWSQTTDVRSFVDSNGDAIDLNGDGITDFVGMGPQGLEFAMGSETAGKYSLGPLTLAQINGTNSDFGDAQGWNDSNTTRVIKKDATTGFYDIIAFGAAGVYVSMGQNPTTHGGQAFGQAYLALANFGLNQGWSNALTPRLVGDVSGDGIADIVGFGANNTFTALGSYNASGDLIFTMDPAATIANYGYNEGWSTSNTVRTLAGVDSGADALVVTGATGTQTLKFG